MNVVDAEQDRLQSLEQQFSRWQDWILEQSNSDALDPDIVRRMAQTVERLVTLDGELHEEDFDPQALAELRGYIIRMIGIASKFDEADALDQLDQALVTLEAMRQIVRAALDQHIDGVGHDPAQAVAGIYAALSHQRKSEIAKLVGVSPRHLQRLARGEGTAPRRLELVARLVALL
jgi:hypothetical protein